jgi:hypothetical protein
MSHGTEPLRSLEMPRLLLVKLNHCHYYEPLLVNHYDALLLKLLVAGTATISILFGFSSIFTFVYIFIRILTYLTRSICI